MTPSEELRTRLRKYLNEPIPPDGMEDDTRFSNEDLDEMLLEASNVYESAAFGWLLKAGMYQDEMGDVERTVTGQEQYQFVRLQERLKYAQEMHSHYRELAANEGVLPRVRHAVILPVRRPDV